MTLVKTFINGTEKTILGASVTKQGERGADQAKFNLPTNVNSNVNDCISYLQDIVNTDNLKLFLSFDCVLGDESGQQNHAKGFDNIPSTISHWEFECDLIDTGCRGYNLSVVCGCETYVCGKICKAFSFDGTRYLQDVCGCGESCYCIREYQKFSISFWVKPTNICCNQVYVAKGNDITCLTGYAIYLCGSSNKINFDIGDGCNTASVSSSIISTCIPIHVTATFDGTKNETGMSLYINGDCDTNCQVSQAITNISNAQNFTVGAESDGGLIAKCGTYIDDLYVFIRELTTCEVARVYHNGAFTYDSCGKWGKSVQFDGCSSHFTICDSSDFDLCGKFEGIWWMKAAPSCCTRTVFHKTTNGTDGMDFGINTCNKAVFRFGCTTLTSCTNVADCSFHQIRVKRDGCNTLSLAICNTVECCSVDCSDRSTCIAFEFGRDQCDNQSFNGELDSFRWYKGNLNSSEECTLATKKNPINVLRFGGKVTKVEKNISDKEVVAQSFGKVLGEVEVRSKIYLCKSPEFIIQDVLTNNSCLTVVPYPTSSNIILKQYVADGKIIDIIEELISSIGAIFYTDGNNAFHYEPKKFNLRSNTFTHGTNSRIWETKYDDTQLVNDLTVVGSSQTYSTCELFSGDCCTTEFKLSESPITAKIEHPLCTELTPQSQYNINTCSNIITFASAPATGCCNIKVSYDYELPIIVKSKKQGSIDSYGKYSKKLILQWVKTREDGVRFSAGYLNRFSQVQQNLKVEHPSLITSIRENDVIRVVNDIKGINDTFIIKSMTFKWPEFTTTMEVGEYGFDDYEYDKDMFQKIHDLENTIVRNRTIINYENPEECIDITDVVSINTHIQAIPECISISDCADSTEIFDAIYSCCCTHYSCNDAYA